MMIALRPIHCALLLGASAGATTLPAVTLEGYAQQRPLRLFAAIKGVTMPNSIDQTVNLKEGDRALLLSGLGLTDLAGISRLRVIDRGKQVPITSVPRLHLFLNRNEIAALPEEIAALHNVVFLYSDHNQLRGLPRALLAMDSLEGMYFAANRFTEIPAIVFEMVQLKKLQFSDNRITILPAAIGNLKELRALMIAGNRIASIPESISNLVRLRVCDLSDNPFTELPESFGRVQIVNQLRVRNTGITSLPEGFATMRGTIDVTGTKIDFARLSPAMRARINTEKPPGSKDKDKIIVRRPATR